MADFDSPNRRQRRFVVALSVAPSVEAAATVAGISERTAYRYLLEPSVKALLSQALDNAQGQATRRVVGEMTAALDTLAAIHADKEARASARVSAARAILSAGPVLREALDLAGRVAELEEHLAESETVRSV